MTAPTGPRRTPAHALATLLTTFVLAGCGGGGDSVAPPAGTGRVALAVPGVPRAAVVGTAFSYDASRGGTTFRDSLGRGLTYTTTVTGDAGLAGDGPRVVGTPTRPGVFRVHLAAQDAGGAIATDTFSIAVFAAGLRTPALPTVPYAYSDANAPLPPHFGAPGIGGTILDTDNTPAANRITDEGATLGRVLFHDRRLSAGDQVSCASCHVRAFGFADSGRVSVGIDGRLGQRRSMPLVNARFYAPGRFFWDHRAATAEAQVLQPIQDANEMGLPLAHLVTKLRVTPHYVPLFRAAFGTDEVTSERVSRALAQYVRAIVARSSRFDSAFAGGGPPDFAGKFTAQELEGQQLFNGAGRCAQCHSTNAHVGIAPQNIGLDATTVDVGAGDGRFKTPSLRNVAQRRRFMHDGRFTTLEQVVEFYDSGVQAHPQLDGRMAEADGQPRRLNFTAAQRAALVAYLRTLTDHSLATAPRFSDPFAP